MSKGQHIEEVVLVNEHDEPQGTMEKMEAHQTGVLHRAISVFIFNSKGDWLLQRRADAKYHSPGLWSNGCCSHPRLNEEPIDAAHRRLQEELGMETELNKAFHFIYREDVGQGLIEHELDHVFVGVSEDLPDFNPEEVGECRFVGPGELATELNENPENFTVWFRLIYNRVQLYLASLN